MKTKLNRRRVLKGLLGTSSIALGLPPLNAMFNENGTAYAQGGQVTKRLGVWYWGSGMRPERFWPQETGPNWTSDGLKPLEHLRADIAVVQGLGVPDTSAGAHFGGLYCGLTGSTQSASKFEPKRGTVITPSMDQICAKEWEGQTLFRSIESAVSLVGGNSKRQGYGLTSWNGPDDKNEPAWTPAELFDKLFSGGLPEGMTATDVTRSRVSMLDALKADANALSMRLGTGDRQRLEDHLNGFRELERQVSFSAGACDVPGRPAEGKEDPGHELLEEKNELTAELMKLALSCDLTRAFTYQWSPMQANTIVWQVGAKEGMHLMTHKTPRGGSAQPELMHKAATFVMGQYAVLLDKLKSVPEGAGTLLDNTLIMTSTDVADGTKHSTNNMPLIMGGGAGGAFKKGAHYRFNNYNTSDMLLTMLHAVDVKKASVGAGRGQSNKVIEELLT